MSSSEPIEAPAQLGETIGGYVLDEVLGSGAMGWVYGARHAFLGRRAAVKVLLPRFAKGKSHVSRLFNEARVVNDVKHANVVDVFDFVMQQEPRRVAIIMERIEGPDLAKRLTQGPFSWQCAVDLTCELLDVLRAVHALGVVHRDLKPQNLVFTSEAAELGEAPRIKVLDFGIAKFTQTEVAHRTVVGSALGTPAYMAPEQAGGMDIGAPADVYAIGEMLFEMVTGRRLFEGGAGEIRVQKREREPIPIAQVYDVEPPELAGIIRSCLEFEPEDRPSIPDLQLALHNLLAAQKKGIVTKSWLPLAAALLLLLVGVIFGVGWSFLGESSPADGPGQQHVQRPPVTKTAVVPKPAETGPTEMAAVADSPPDAGRSAVVAAPPDDPKPAVRPKTRSTKSSRRTRRPRARTAAANPPPKPAVTAPQKSAVKVEAWTTGGRRVAAAVFVDGERTAKKTPVELQLSAGRHTIRLVPSGYPERRETIVVPKTKRLDVVVDVPE